MKKAINILALVTFVWLLLDALRIPDMVLNFLIAGELPFANISLSPSFMIALLSATAGLIIIELLIRGFNLDRRIRSLGSIRERVQKRRLERI